MAFRSMFHLILPVSLILLTVFLFLCSRKLSWTKRLAVTVPEQLDSRKFSLKNSKAAIHPLGSGDWGGGPAFKDSWEDGSEQRIDIQFTFTDNGAKRTS